MYLLGRSFNVQSNLYPIKNGTYKLGKSLNNNIIISDDPTVASEHAAIYVKNNEAKLCVTGKNCKVFVNNKKIKQTTLLNDDEILLGSTTFKYIQDETQLIDQQGNKIIFSKNQNFITSERDHGFTSSSVPVEKIKDKLCSIYEFSNALNKTKNKEVLINILIKTIQTHCNAKRILLFLWDNNTECFELEKGFSDTKPLKNNEICLSQTLFSTVMSEKKAILCQDITTDERFKNSESLQGQSIQSIMCIPIQSKKLLGIIYLDSPYKIIDFSSENLDFLCAVANQTAIALENIMVQSNLLNENRWLNESIKNQQSFIGDCKVTSELLKMVKRISPININVLLRGETGTGKELIAKMIHNNSPRANYPFISVNCSLLNENLLESELFGHEKGAFSGALEKKIGKFEIPDGGTIFLDEIGEVNLNVQVKLLNFLQNRCFERVGGTKPIYVNIRIIAATNRNLEEAIKKGLFREDLYYRLQVVQIDLPPLRDKKNDITILANYFVKQFSNEINCPPKTMSTKFLSLLENFNWPGNVRQLKNVIERSIVLSTGNKLYPEDLPWEITSFKHTSTDADSYNILNYKIASDAFEKEFLHRLLQHTKGHITKASEISKIDRSHLHSKLKKYNINPLLYKILNNK